jgi:hypothetical protein
VAATELLQENLLHCAKKKIAVEFMNGLNRHTDEGCTSLEMAEQAS